MKTMTTHEGKTCKPQRIPRNAKLTGPQIQNAYDEIAEQYEKKIWFDQHVLGVARLKKNCFQKREAKFWKWHVESARTFPCSQLAVTSQRST